MVPAFILNFVASPSLLSILGARLLFNMKEAGEKGLNQGTSCGAKSTMSDIDFAVPLQVTTSELEGKLEEPEVIELSEMH